MLMATPVKFHPLRPKSHFQAPKTFRYRYRYTETKSSNGEERRGKEGSERRENLQSARARRKTQVTSYHITATG
ncbi:hypothetical protein EAF00_007729 [Botryotinia globosa]|nr:hypothetical protein EAF00_007729 [Botryotinia globosa]